MGLPSGEVFGVPRKDDNFSTISSETMCSSWQAMASAWRGGYPRFSTRNTSHMRRLRNRRAASRRPVDGKFNTFVRGVTNQISFFQLFDHLIGRYRLDLKSLSQMIHRHRVDAILICLGDYHQIHFLTVVHVIVNLINNYKMLCYSI